ncbi:engB [Symbiodinium natans]|uniref:EngB protein n=1 Tax=Symbiodinium natans TaxID=878477 RepID=A0A812SSW7_9DINO|nr:engB [Symbiodinium natans]
MQTSLEAELRGFVAEAEIDQRGEVAYVDHIKTWVPILFELRKSRIYDGIVAKEWGPDEEELINLQSYEAQFPLHQTGEEEERPASVASSASGKSARARKKEKTAGKASRNSSRSLRSDSQSSLGSERSHASRR